MSGRAGGRTDGLATGLAGWGGRAGRPAGGEGRLYSQSFDCLTHRVDTSIIIRASMPNQMHSIIFASAEHSWMELAQFPNKPDLHGVDGGCLGGARFGMCWM